MTKINVPIDNKIFSDLPQKEKKLREIGKQAVLNYMKNDVDDYNKLSWWGKFCSGDHIEETDYLGEKVKHVDFWGYHYALLEGDWYFDMAMFLDKMDKTISFCRENGVDSIDLTQEELLKLIREI